MPSPSTDRHTNDPAAAPAGDASWGQHNPAGATLGLRPLAAITGLFWLYASVSAVLYAYGLGAGMATLTAEPFFADWTARMLQYALLFLPLLGCYRLSLGWGWRPTLGRGAVQLALGVAFAVIAYPMLFAAQGLLGQLEHEEPMGAMAQGTAKLLAEPHFFQTWLASATDFLVRYGFGLALVTGFATYKQFRDAEMRASALQRQWSEARLAALRMQLSPHTLFNLLTTIRGHITWDPPAAQEMVVQLADLLRRLLNAGERDYSRLADELQFVQLYLELQRRRFPDRLTLALPEAGGLPPAWVPSLILQPLVENAVAHGMAGHVGPVRVEVSVAVEDGELCLRVINSVAAGAVAGDEGIGLRNVRERLAVQLGSAAALTVGHASETQWLAEIRMPLLREPPAPAATGQASVGTP
ncbi:MAG: histidine kinase [Gammaproteobacteria bacterium]|nr:histidine kinase [Gammaproteobacteria bacterium]